MFLLSSLPCPILIPYSLSSENISSINNVHWIPVPDSATRELVQSYMLMSLSFSLIHFREEKFYTLHRLLGAPHSPHRHRDPNTPLLVHPQTKRPKHTLTRTLSSPPSSPSHTPKTVPMADGDGATLSSRLGLSIVCINKRQIGTQINGYEFHVRLGLISLGTLLWDNQYSVIRKQF